MRPLLVCDGVAGALLLLAILRQGCSIPGFAPQAQLSARHSKVLFSRQETWMAFVFRGSTKNNGLYIFSSTCNSHGIQFVCCQARRIVGVLSRERGRQNAGQTMATAQDCICDFARLLMGDRKSTRLNSSYASISYA